MKALNSSKEVCLDHTITLSALLVLRKSSSSLSFAGLMHT